MDYFKQLQYDTSSLKSLSDDWFGSAGICSRMTTRGAQLNIDFKAMYDKLVILAIEKTITTNHIKKWVDPDLATVNHYERLDSCVDSIMNKQKFDIVTGVEFEGLSGTNRTDMINYIKRNRAELQDTELVKECYNITNKQKNDLIKLYNLVESFLTVERKPKKIKTVSPVDMVKKLKYLAKSDKYSFKSIKPTRIIGKKKLIIFNCKTRRLGIFVCSGDNKLSVSGTTILGFDEGLSFAKTDRTPNDNTMKIIQLSSSAASKEFNNMKTTSQKLSGRMNKDIMLLKVY